MSEKDYLGQLEQLMLLAVMRLGTNAYGMMIRRVIEEQTGREIAIGAVYSTLERLELKGYIKSVFGDPTHERGGRAKKYFLLNASGQKALVESQRILAQMKKGFEPIFEM
jgi:PadR family transcriptional regulator, regulatory protein PadR